MKGRLALLSAIALAFSLLGAAAAQGGKRREELAEKLKMYRKIVVAEELGLDETTTTKLFAVLDVYFEKLKDSRQEQRKLKTALESEAAKARPDDKVLDDLLDKLVEKEKEFQKLRIDSFTATEGILTPLQRVQLLDIIGDLDARIRKMIDAAKKGK
jgi:Spy/CpxP family protein refolding chaperone